MILDRSRPLPVRFVLPERSTTLCHQTQHPFGAGSGNDFHMASALLFTQRGGKVILECYSISKRKGRKYFR